MKNRNHLFASGRPLKMSFFLNSIKKKLKVNDFSDPQEVGNSSGKGAVFVLTKTVSYLNINGNKLLSLQK